MDKLSNSELLDACNWQVHKWAVCDDSECECLDEFKCCKVAKLHPLGTDECTEEQKVVIKRARQLLKQRKLCHLCGKKLVPVGYSRQNGKIHKDWPKREYHKKCWLSVMRGDVYVSGGNETDTEEGTDT